MLEVKGYVDRETRDRYNRGTDFFGKSNRELGVYDAIKGRRGS